MNHASRVRSLSVPYRITVRVSKDTMNQLEELVENFQYETVSDIVRRAIDEFIERNYRKGPTAKIDLVLPKKVMQDLESDLKRNISEMNTELETLKENVKMVVSLYEMVSKKFNPLW